MLEELTNIEGLEVYTPLGVRVGNITGVEVDDEEGNISGLLAEDTNPNLVEMGAPLLIPFRWIQAVGDVIILRHFPEEIPIPAPSEFGMEEYKE